MANNEWLDRLVFRLMGARAARAAGETEAESGALSVVFDDADPEESLTRYAEISESAGRIERAEAALERAIAVFRVVGEDLKVAALRQELIELHSRHGDAEPLARSAVDELNALVPRLADWPAHQNQASRLLAYAQASLAKALGAKGDVNEAHKHNVEALKLAAETGALDLEARLRPLTGLVYASPKQAGAAVGELTRALELIDRGDASLKPLLLRHRGEMWMRLAETGQGDLSRAESTKRATADFLEAGPLFEAQGDPRAAGHCWYQAATNVSWEHYVDRDPEGLGLARNLYARAERQHVQAGVEAPYAAITRSQLATIFWQLGEPAEAARWFRSSAWLFHRLRLPRERTVSLLGAAAMEVDVRDAPTDRGRAVVPRFLRTFQRALRSWRQWGAEALTSDQRRFEDENAFYLRHVFTKMLDEAEADPALALRAAAAAWDTEQLTKATDLLDALALRELAADPELQELLAGVAAARAGLELLATPSQDDPALKIRYRSQRDRARSALATAERAARARADVLSQRDALTREMGKPSLAAVQDLQRHLRSDELYVGFFWNGGTPVRLTVTSSNDLRVERVQNGGGDTWKHVEAWVKAARGGQAPAADPELALRLMGRIPAEVGTLLVCPDGELANLPWHGLDYQGERLEQRVTVAVVPSASTLVFTRSAATKAGPDRAYLGVAENANGRIPLVDDEVRRVRDQYFPGAEILESGRSHEILGRKDSVGLLHVACHASREGLLLAGNRLVHPYELARVGIRAEILLLAGCETGQFDFDEMNRFDGVVRELLIATGARAAVVSAARVKDEVGLRFSELVVAALTGRNPVPVGEAVTRARRQLRVEQAEGPAGRQGDDWSLPWYVIGDPGAKLTFTG